MLREVPASNRIQWESFTVTNADRVNLKIAMHVVEASADILDILVGKTIYYPYRHQSARNETVIGYGYGDTDSVDGYTEAEAYSEWLKAIKIKQRELKAQLPLLAITQSHFDALFSLYVMTKTWRRIDSDLGVFDAEAAIIRGDWRLIADMLANGSVDREDRQIEARVLQLADYSNSNTRERSKFQGIQDARVQYARTISDTLARKQLEAGYYRQTRSFVPGISDLRKRELIAKYGKL